MRNLSLEHHYGNMEKPVSILPLPLGASGDIIEIVGGMVSWKEALQSKVLEFPFPIKMLDVFEGLRLTNSTKKGQ